MFHQWQEYWRTHGTKVILLTAHVDERILEAAYKVRHEKWKLKQINFAPGEQPDEVDLRIHNEPEHPTLDELYSLLTAKRKGLKKVMLLYCSDLQWERLLRDDKATHPDHQASIHSVTKTIFQSADVLGATQMRNMNLHKCHDGLYPIWRISDLGCRGRDYHGVTM